MRPAALRFIALRLQKMETANNINNMPTYPSKVRMKGWWAQF